MSSAQKPGQKTPCDRYVDGAVMVDSCPGRLYGLSAVLSSCSPRQVTAPSRGTSVFKNRAPLDLLVVNSAALFTMYLPQYQSS